MVFSVHDGLSGFPLSYVESEKEGAAAFTIREGMLWAKPAKTTNVEGCGPPEQDVKGFVCTGDLVEIAGDRVFFRGRKDSIANIGGVKVAIETVEDVVRQHADVLDCRITLKPSPILGTVLALQVVARDANSNEGGFRAAIGKWCRESLPREARPATISVVADLPRNAAGKVARV